jgi:MoxR-like ATPase
VEELAKPESLIVITSNEERELPPAFERRCVVYRLEDHNEKTLRQIALNHVRDDRAYPLDHLIDELTAARKHARDAQRRPPSTAEFIDAIRACLGEGITTATHSHLEDVLRMIFRKNTRGDTGQGWPA